MSDTPQGPRWWQATDGNWYPPELHPDFTAPPPPPPTPLGPGGFPPQYPQQPMSAVQQPAPTHPYQPHQQVQPGVQIPYQQWTGPGYGTVPPGPQKKRRRWPRRVLFFALGLVALVVVANVLSDDDNATATTASTGAESSPSVAATEPSTAPGAESETAGSQTQPDAAGVAEPTAPPPTEPTAVGTRENPVPLGQPATITLSALGDADNSQWTVTVDGPGTDITAAVLAENEFNEPPADGHAFYGVPVTVTLNEAGKEPLSLFFNLTLEYFGPSSLSIISDLSTEGCGVTPNPVDDTKEVFIGGSISGTLCYSVTNDDIAGGVLLTTDDIQGDRVFLATR